MVLINFVDFLPCCCCFPPYFFKNSFSWCQSGRPDTILAVQCLYFLVFGPILKKCYPKWYQRIPGGYNVRKVKFFSKIYGKKKFIFRKYVKSWWKSFARIICMCLTQWQLFEILSPICFCELTSLIGLF